MSCESLEVVTFESGSQLAYVGKDAFEKALLKPVALPANLISSNTPPSLDSEKLGDCLVPSCIPGLPC